MCDKIVRTCATVVASCACAVCCCLPLLSFCFSTTIKPTVCTLCVIVHVCCCTLSEEHVMDVNQGRLSGDVPMAASSTRAVELVAGVTSGTLLPVHTKGFHACVCAVACNRTQDADARESKGVNRRSSVTQYQHDTTAPFGHTTVTPCSLVGHSSQQPQHATARSALYSFIQQHESIVQHKHVYSRLGHTVAVHTHRGAFNIVPVLFTVVQCAFVAF